MAIALDVNEISTALATIGFYVVFLGLASQAIQNQMFLPGALIAILLGIITGPSVLGWNDPRSWQSSEEGFDELTYHLTRITLGVQVLFIGISLPAKWVKAEWRSLGMLLGPVMGVKWLSAGLLVWGFIPDINYLEALIISACVTPTDPIFSNAVIKGAFAEKNVRLEVRNLIIGEAGANDGFGFPFLYIVLFIYTRSTGEHSVGWAIGNWFYNGLAYQIGLGILYGILVGWVARHCVRIAEDKRLIDHDHFSAYGLGLAFWILGTAGTLGLDDVMACYAAGNSFTWDDRYRVRTDENPFQDVIDSVINAGIFIYIGAILDFSDWYSETTPLTVWRVVVLGILSALVTRLPVLLALYKFIPTIRTFKEAAFVGYFGPVAVGAIFYVQVTLLYLQSHDGHEHLQAVLRPTVYATVLVSAIMNGMLIPVAYAFPVWLRELARKDDTAASDEKIEAKVEQGLSKETTMSEAVSGEGSGEGSTVAMEGR